MTSSIAWLSAAAQSGSFSVWAPGPEKEKACNFTLPANSKLCLFKEGKLYKSELSSKTRLAFAVQPVFNSGHDCTLQNEATFQLTYSQTLLLVLLTLPYTFTHKPAHTRGLSIEFDSSILQEYAESSSKNLWRLSDLLPSESHVKSTKLSWLLLLLTLDFHLLMRTSNNSVRGI